VAIFRHKDQMDVHLKNTVSSSSDIVIIAHRPRIQLRYATTSGLQIRTNARWPAGAANPPFRWLLPVCLQ
jgi:hypothetical protein